MVRAPWELSKMVFTSFDIPFLRRQGVARAVLYAIDWWYNA